MTPEEARQYVSRQFPFPGYMDSSGDSYISISNTVRKYLKQGARLLDFGSGPCDKTAVIQALGYRCSAYDDLSDDWHTSGSNREKITQFALKAGIDFRLACEDTFPFDAESFDMVMAHHVLEHLHDSPRDLLNDLVELIKPGGYLFITVPNAANIRKRMAVMFGRTNLPSFGTYYWYPGHWRGHVREYVKDDLQKLAGYLALNVEELRSCHHMLTKLAPGVRSIYVLVCRIFPGWRDSWLLVGRKPHGWVPKRRLSEDECVAAMGDAKPHDR